MIIDCHTHIWAGADQMGQAGEAMRRRACGGQAPLAGTADHSQAAQCVGKTLVFAYRASAAGAHVPNSYVAEYVSANAARMLGVAAVDPTNRASLRETPALLGNKAFCGLTIDAAGAGFHPADSRAMGVYAAAAEAPKPLFFCHGRHLIIGSRMEYARPSLLEEIALEYPSLTIVIASMGYPWVDECIALVARHDRIYADAAPLLRWPWQAHNALVRAHECKVIDKVLFGSDFPCCTAAEAIETVYRLNEVAQGTNLPTIPREALRSMVERRALTALGIGGDDEPPATATEADQADQNEEEDQVHWQSS